MKNIVLIFAVAIVLTGVSCQNKKQDNKQAVTSDLIKNPATAEGKAETGKLPVIEFNKVKHDFGLIVQGEKVSYIFKFKNTGGSDLIIKNAKASCGCTVPRFPREPLPPGEEGEVEVIFDSHGRSGKQVKTVNVWSNCQPNKTTLTIESEIIVPN